ncbi:MAG TPA: gamma carbonic anhydrase family protein [Rhizomicrobium sp.]|jgi:carbonic anhydrase/acetyltransferase-like protein (isoleucine patch superfamily)|nr:gamma carbonic anhydrase family protein [Rhizomicrobium sp.]
MPIYALDGVRPDIAEGCFIAPDAVLVGKVFVRKGASIWFGAVLRGDNEVITVGEDSNVQDHSILHADPGQPVVIGRGVTIGHRVIVHSAQVGEGSLIGMGAVLLNRARIGAGCLVGAGALVTEDRQFDDGKLILGSPAKTIRDLAPEQAADLKRSAEIYVANGARYAAGLRQVARGI